MSSLLTDDFGREVTDIRISLTDRCNFDCFYCHNEGLGDTRGPREPQENEMSTAEVLRIARVAHEFGIRNFKITGGEPMLRDDLEEIVGGIADLEGTEVSMTTNGTFLAGRAEGLAERGLERINVSMDTNDPEEFRDVTKGGIERVYDGIDAALDAGLAPVKLNMVMAKPMRPYLDDMIEYVTDNDGLRLQIIEYMPEIAGMPEFHVEIDEIKSLLARRADGVTTREIHNRSRYEIDGTVVEVVDPVENPEFCANCHRIRVTHSGGLKGCLNRNDDVVSTLGATDDELRDKFRKVVADRVPYYGEYMVKDDDGNWVKNPEYEDDDAEADTDDILKLPVIN
ncbi:GTP 3',8-cyclase MoaA [Halorutilales archaeon Cl-col2-1]